MKFGAEFPRNMSLKGLIELARVCEEAGFSSLWATDLLAKGEVWVTLAAIASSTSRIKLGIDVTNPFTRHPVITAQALATLQELSDGRAILGMGAGIKNILNRMGIKPAEASLALRESFDIIKDLLSGKEVNYEGKVFTVKQFRLPYASALNQPPFYLACLLPEEARLAGETADGILTISLHEGYLEHLLGISRRAGQGKPIKLATWAVGMPTGDIHLIKREAGPLIFPMLANLPQEVLNHINIHGPEVEGVRKALMQGSYDSLSEETLSPFVLFGSGEQIKKRMERLGEIGVDELVLHFKSKEEVRAFSRLVGLKG